MITKQASVAASSSSSSPYIWKERLSSKPQSQLPWIFQIVDLERTITKQTLNRSFLNKLSAPIYGKNDYKAKPSRTFQ